jgi:eukaryotic-like serine/threonine-protein kinase
MPWHSGSAVKKPGIQGESGVSETFGKIPERIGKYELRGVLGKGTSGTVYFARDSFTHAEVALKVLDPGLFADEESSSVLRAQFLNEASLAGQLHHPHLVSILDAVVTDTAGHIAMEYVPGGTLSQFTNPQNLYSIEDAIQVGFKCCGALDYAFRQGIVHRDIKPANILRVSGTEIKISDFGAAYLRKSQALSGMNFGSPAYMSPEQISGGELTHKSDMFSAGVVLFELLTGQRPFAGRSLKTTLDAVLKAETPRPSSVRPELPKEIDAILLQVLAKNPDDRFDGWADFALALAKVGGLSGRHHNIQDSEKYASLRGIEMLARLTDPQIWELVRAGRWMRLPPHSPIIREQQPGRHLFFLAEGQAKVSREGRALNLIDAGECFGEMSYIRGGDSVRKASIESITEVLIAEFEDDALERMSSECQLHFTRALVRTLVERLEFANARLGQGQAV